MKTKYFILAAAALILAACQKDNGKQDADAVISVSPDKVEATYEGVETTVAVTANCEWNISKTDAEGAAVDWVKCDLSKGKGNKTLGIKVERNPKGAARNATVTLYSGEVKAFIDIKQAANPSPDPEGDEEPDYLVLAFDFTKALEGWPTAIDQSWAELKDCDSGCATDNGGTAVAANSHRRAKVKYTIDGKDYYFTFADPNGAEKHNIYLGTTGVYSGTYRYFGLPAIEGKKLAKVEMVQNASNQDPEKFNRAVGVSKWIYHKDFPVDDIEYVSGGDPQNQAETNGKVYTYKLSGTCGNTVYYMNSPVKASIIKSLTLYYADLTGKEPDPGKEPEDPKPSDPGEGGEVVIDPNALRLSFDFTGEPLEGWPTAPKYTHVDGGIECKYPLDGVDFIFVPADCDGASAGQAFWQPPVAADGDTPAKAGYFALNAQYRYLGLPMVANHSLVQVVCHSCQLGAVTTAAKMGITKSIAKSAAHPAASEFVSGGDYQTWAATGGDYTYSLSNTEVATRYYIYANAKGAIAKLDLVYNPAK